MVLVIPLVDNQTDSSLGGEAGSGDTGVSGGGGDALELQGEHIEVEDLDEGEFGFVLPKLNLDLRCFEWREDVTFFCVIRVLSVLQSIRENLWNLLPHLHEAIYLSCHS